MRWCFFISDDNNAVDAGGRVSKLRECATRRNLSNLNKIYQPVFQYFVCLICFDFVWFLAQRATNKSFWHTPLQCWNDGMQQYRILCVFLSKTTCLYVEKPLVHKVLRSTFEVLLRRLLCLFAANLRWISRFFTAFLVLLVFYLYICRIIILSYVYLATRWLDAV